MSEAKNCKKNVEKTSKNAKKTEKIANFAKNGPKNVILEPGERMEDLQCGGLKIIQNKDLYCFTSDSVVLANFVRTKAADEAVEIGCGCGVISILLQAKNSLKSVVAFEIQPPLAALASKNVALNGLEEKIRVVAEDVKNFEKVLKSGSADVVFCNPPYFKPTNFAQTECNRIAKEEVSLSLDELCCVAARMLKSGGNFYFCIPAERVAEAIVKLFNNRLSTKEIFFTENGKGVVKTAFLRAVKDGKFGTKVHPNLVTNSQSGDYLEVLKTKNFLN